MELDSDSTTYLLPFSNSVTLYTLIGPAILQNEWNYRRIPGETGNALAVVFMVTATEALSLKVTAFQYWQRQSGTVN